MRTNIVKACDNFVHPQLTAIPKFPMPRLNIPDFATIHAKRFNRYRLALFLPCSFPIRPKFRHLSYAYENEFIPFPWANSVRRGVKMRTIGLPSRAAVTTCVKHQVATLKRFRNDQDGSMTVYTFFILIFMLIM